MSETKILYRIKPTDKKSIKIVYDVYKKHSDGSTVGWTVSELYRWGQGFVETEDELPYSDDRHVLIDPAIGDGCDLDDGISIDFEYDDEITEEEREHIEKCWCDGDPDDEYGRGNAAWLYDVSDWTVDCDSVIIYGPFEVDKITYSDYNIVSEERIELKPRPPRDKSVAWPF
jgi:hypothetical protein